MTFPSTRPTLFNRDPYTPVNASSIPPQILDTIVAILKSWDQPFNDHAYMARFHPSGSLHIMPEPSTGHDAMRQLHDSVINPTNGPIIDLQHYLDRVFLMPASPSGKSEAVVTGKLTNVLKNGEQVTVDFATWVVMSHEHGGSEDMKVELLRVFSDSSVLMARIGEMMAQGQGLN